MSEYNRTDMAGENPRSIHPELKWQSMGKSKEILPDYIS
jgi:hypothetical protein